MNTISASDSSDPYLREIFSSTLWEKGFASLQGLLPPTSHTPHSKSQPYLKSSSSHCMYMYLCIGMFVCVLVNVPVFILYVPVHHAHV